MSSGRSELRMVPAYRDRGWWRHHTSTDRVLLAIAPEPTGARTHACRCFGSRSGQRHRHHDQPQKNSHQTLRSSWRRDDRRNLLDSTSGRSIPLLRESSLRAWSVGSRPRPTPGPRAATVALSGLRRAAGDLPPTTVRGRRYDGSVRLADSQIALSPSAH